ncbi:efflux transporter outer membrane subunit [Methylomonas methanica]|uniref:RND efflux system, outer membrane lipoprotein, NodT family n=1 Tax=Methylomonas methanica (strain DSM 25384 / MC09) TaxID=857087 RepID=G0A514_METMM|nr:TolC family protein [Methylomonas methanica]AEF99177.1 RND efflux system, outer membrane lipoprotein, NodT family [Methylomonas methanica MC09]
MNNRYLAALTLLSQASLIACTPTRVGDQVALNSPATWQHAPNAQTAEKADLKTWWQGFDDPLLNELIDQALAANLDLKIATARVREANAMVTVAEAALYPSLDFSISGGREKRIDRIVGVPSGQGIKLITPTADAVSGGLAARWEIDLFGGRHLQAEAAAAQAEGSKEGLHAAQVGLLAQVTTNYLELRGVQQRTGILQSNIAVQRERLRTLQAFVKAGLANEADLARQQTLLQGTEAALPGLTSTGEKLIHRLGVLLGEPPESLGSRLTAVGPLPKQAPIMPNLLPADLLAQRPDLRLAQKEVSAAAAGLGSARADLYPKLVLSASGGLGALAVGGFPSLADSVYALGSGLSAPIFNAGRIRAHIAAADARLEQVAANYEKTFLLALEDVENAFVAHRSANDSLGKLTEAEASAEKAYRLVDALYQRGAGNYLAVLDAQRRKLDVSDERAKAETAVSVAMVSLYRAFGGGWIIASSDREMEKALAR